MFSSWELSTEREDDQDYIYRQFCWKTTMISDRDANQELLVDRNENLGIVQAWRY